MKNKIYDVHVHILSPDTYPIDFIIGRMPISSDVIQMLASIYKATPFGFFPILENLIEEVAGKDININNAMKRTLSTYGDVCRLLREDLSGADAQYIALAVFPASSTGSDYSTTAVSIAGDINPDSAGYKAYNKMWDYPDESKLKIINESINPYIYAHCSRGGIWNKEIFTSEKQANNAAHPLRWLSCLERYSNIKIVLCHAGGCSDFIAFADDQVDLSNNWTADCLHLIDLYPDRVYIDTAYHEQCYTQPDKYRKAMRKIGAMYGDNILYGSDWPLVLLDVPTYTAYIEAMQMACGAALWKKISYINYERMIK